MAKRTPDPLITPLRSVTPATFEQLRAALGDASRATTFRYLKQVPYLRSYNHNGRYYTYRDPTRFDRWGLTSLGNVHFSRDQMRLHADYTRVPDQQSVLRDHLVSGGYSSYALRGTYERGLYGSRGFCLTEPFSVFMDLFPEFFV